MKKETISKLLGLFLVLSIVGLYGCDEETKPDPGIKADMEKQRGAMSEGAQPPANQTQGN